jgi:hypothetical protein
MKEKHEPVLVHMKYMDQGWENTYYRENILQYITKITYFSKFEYQYTYLADSSQYLLKYYCAGPSILTYYYTFGYLLLCIVHSDKYSVFMNTFTRKCI